MQTEDGVSGPNEVEKDTFEGWDPSKQVPTWAGHKNTAGVFFSFGKG